MAKIEKIREKEGAAVPTPKSEGSKSEGGASGVVETGDFVSLEFTGKTGGNPFESSGAKPVLIAAGKAQVVRGLDEALVGARVGEKRSIAIPKEKAFGDRNPELVRLVPLQKFKEQGISPAPGLVIDIDGARARVQSVGGGRVRVDFNHDLAGIDVEYDFEVKRVFRSPKDKLDALTDDLLAQFEAKTVLDAAGVARVSVPAKARKDSEFIMRKLRFISNVLQFAAPEVKKVVFEEEYALQ
ncbi:MAG: peptidylprolyl isomerase [Candidatus Micrarchaeota archaeon]